MCGLHLLAFHLNMKNAGKYLALGWEVWILLSQCAWLPFVLKNCICLFVLWVYLCIHTWRSEDSLWNLVLFFSHVWPRYWTSVIKTFGTCLYLLNHLGLQCASLSLTCSCHARFVKKCVWYPTVLLKFAWLFSLNSWGAVHCCLHLCAWAAAVGCVLIHTCLLFRMHTG